MAAINHAARLIIFKYKSKHMYKILSFSKIGYSSHSELNPYNPVYYTSILYKLKFTCMILFPTAMPFLLLAIELFERHVTRLFLHCFFCI